MLYKFVWILARVAFKSYFRKIYLIDRENIPTKGPLLMAVNHPSSFMEPCVLATFQKRSLYFLTRGDVFKKGIASFFLKGTHQIPIFRARDGFENLRKNEESFKACYDALKNNKTIIIFPESRTIWEKKLRLIQKGAARLAFGAKEKYTELDLKIIPVGVNFEDPRKFQSDVIIKFGTPISLEDYWAKYQENDRKTVEELTATIKERFEGLVFNLPSKIHENAFSTLDIIYKNEFENYSFPELITSPKRFIIEKKISEDLAKRTKEDKLLQIISNYQIKLEDLKIYDSTIQNIAIGTRPNYIWFVATAIPWFFGRYTIGLIATLIDNIVDKKVKDDAFIGPIKVGLGIIIYFIFFVILVIVLWLKFNIWGILISMFIMGLAYFVTRNYNYIKSTLNYLNFKNQSQDRVAEMINDRRNIIEYMKSIL